MSPLFVLLGAVDTLAAALLFFPSSFPFSEALVSYMAVYMLAKGGFFLFTGLSSKAMNPFCMGLCVIDVLTGIVLGAMSLGFAPIASGVSASGAFGAFGYVSALKGLYCFTTPIFS